MAIFGPISLLVWLYAAIEYIVLAAYTSRVATALLHNHKLE